MTVPFWVDRDCSVARTRIFSAEVEHLLPPIYHGNPIQNDRSLVFTDFGWDLLSDMEEARLKDAAVNIYASIEFGHVGQCKMSITAVK
jgi:hypothetical protein